jgi:hypothetical protein
MKRIAVLISFFLLSFGNIFSQNSDKLITWKGEKYFVNGINIAWNMFGCDFGNHEDWGSLYDSTWFENMFTDCEKNGVNVIRMWVHSDGRANPEFDENGFVTGPDTDFFIDMDDFFRRAKKHNVMVMLCLWSFDMCRINVDAGRHALGHHDLLKDEKKMDSYINNFFIPLVKRYKDQCNLFAYEVCNEPEWALDRLHTLDTNWTFQTEELVPIESMQKLTAKMAAVVHEYSDKLVTTGCSAIRWNSDVYPAYANWWSDKALQKQYANPKAFLDFYQIHYYDYMVPLQADPFDTTRTTAYWQFDKPTIIGEMPGSKEKSTIYTNTEMINKAYQNGYAGVMFWSYNGKDGFGAWADFKSDLKLFKEQHTDIVEPQVCPCQKLDAEKLALKTEKTDENIKITWTDSDPIITNHYRIETSSDGKNWAVAKKIKKKEGKENYQVKLKFSKLANTSKFRLVHKDYWGYESFSIEI